MNNILRNINVAQMDFVLVARPLLKVGDGIVTAAIPRNEHVIAATVSKEIIAQSAVKQIARSLIDYLIPTYIKTLTFLTKG